MALAAAGLPFVPELVVPALNYHRADGALAMNALLDMRNPPDAVFCFNDLLAVGAMRATAERFVRVPRDLAVVGFDNNDESAYSSPSLTTIAPDKGRSRGRRWSCCGGGWLPVMCLSMTCRPRSRCRSGRARWHDRMVRPLQSRVGLIRLAVEERNRTNATGASATAARAIPAADSTGHR